MNPLLELRGISFSYAKRRILDQIDLTLDARTCTALVGPNGVGKTTLLRIISGALSAVSGEVLLGGRSLHAMAARQRAQQIALVPQQFDIPFDFSVQQIVEQGRTPYMGLLHGLMREDRLAVDRALDLANVSGLRHRIFNELSGGERQCVKIALALAQQPKLLLLDEPTQHLDIGRQVELIDLLQFLCTQGITMLVSIHDLHLVPGNFSSVLLLAPDRSLTVGTSEDVLTPQRLTDAFRCAPGRHPLMMEEA
jgi:ABC-type cobalamin/Fe3+-siderophores transport system ATPase subunit